MTSYIVTVRDDTGVQPFQARVPATPEARDAALTLAVAVLVTLKFHLPSAGHSITLVAQP